MLTLSGILQCDTSWQIFTDFNVSHKNVLTVLWVRHNFFLWEIKRDPPDSTVNIWFVFLKKYNTVYLIF